MDRFLPSNLKSVVVCTRPVSMRWGVTRLISFLRDELGMPVEPGTAYLFVNRAQDQMIAFWRADDGDQSIQKKLDRGAFLMPAPRADGPLVRMRPTAVSTLFR